jgi:hypothetical protein
MDEPLLSAREQWKLVKESFTKGLTFDGCSGVPDLNFGIDCCGEHDYHYQNLGVTRAEADKYLRQCMQDKGYWVLPWVYWIGVRLLGARHYRKRQNETTQTNAALGSPPADA